MCNFYRSGVQTVCVVIGSLAIVSIASAQTTTATNGAANSGFSATNQLQQLLSNFQGVGAMGGLNSAASSGGLSQIGSSNDQTSTGTNTGVGQTGGTGTGGQGQVTAPTITNQFTAHRGAAVAARRPGLQLEQALAIHTGTNPFTNTTRIDDKSFLRNAFEMLVLNVLDGFNPNITGLLGGTGLTGLGGGLNGLSGLTGLSSLFNPTATPNQQTTITPIANPTTTGQGTSTTLP